MYRITINRFFDAAHKLPDSADLITKQCANLHGHTYLCKVVAHSYENKRRGMVVDFKAIKDIIDDFDHQFINDVFANTSSTWAGMPTTAENIAKYIHDRIRDAYPDLHHVEVSICEGYKGRESSSFVDYKISPSFQ